MDVGGCKRLKGAVMKEIARTEVKVEVEVER